uniref:Histone-lysine N-methyltransferase n=1 Tax=Anopheles stephensi TaxID=30069 RepID=A0A182Y4A6_ANOST
MDFIGDLLNQMSSAFNQETAIPKKEEISMDETLKWRALKNNQFASRTRFPHQIASGTGSGGSTRGGLANGRKSGTTSGSTAYRQRRQTAGGTSSDSRSAATGDDGSRSPASLLGENGTLTHEAAADEEQEEGEGGEDIEIEIAKDISGEELQEALSGLSQLVEVESEDFGATLEIEDRMETGENSGDLLLEEEKKSSPTMEEQRIAMETEIGLEDCKAEDAIDTKVSLEVPYCSSASVSPTVLLEQKDIVSEQLVLLPSKCDTDETDALMETDETQESKTSSSLEHGETAADKGSGCDLVESKSAAQIDEQEIAIDTASKTIEEIDADAKVGENEDEDHAGTSTALADPDEVPMLDDVQDDDDEDDVLIINTDDVDEVVELAETSKEDEDDEEELSKNDDHETTTVVLQSKDVDAQSIGEEAIEKHEASEPESDAPGKGQNIAERVEEKFDPKESADAANRDVDQDRDRSSNDCDEIKFSDSLKVSLSGNQAEQNDPPQTPVGEKVEEKTESTMVEEHKSNANKTDERSEKEASNISIEVGAEKSEQPAASAAAGRTTRSKKITATVSPAANTSPPAGITAITTQSQRRSQRFQKDSTSVASSSEGKLNGENAVEPMLIVKEEDPDDTVALRKRASVGATTAAETKLKAGVKSDRSLRSKQQGSSVTTQPSSSSVLTRRASETIKASPDESNDTQDGPDADKTMAGRRGRKRLSQDRSAASSVVSNDPVTRTREKSTKNEEVPKLESSTVAGQGRVSRSGFPVEPDENDTGGAKVPDAPEPETVAQQQQPAQPQRRGRKRKNLNVSDKDSATPTAAPSAASGSGAASADKSLLHPYKRAARQSRDGSDGILASALARRDKVNSQGRLSRQIKLSAKILANEELRQGYEQQNNGRIIVAPEQHVAVNLNEDELSTSDRDRQVEQQAVEKQRKQGRDANDFSIASCSTIGSSSEDVTLVSVSLPAPKPGVSGTKRNLTVQDPDCAASSLTQHQQNKKLVAAASSSERTTALKRTLKQNVSNASSCPSVETFLQQVRSLRLGTNRSPEENRKLNRRQQKRMVKMKEKFMNSLSLRRRSAQQSRSGTEGDEFDVEASGGEPESSGSEADFVPTQKIGTVGRPSVTLRLRKPETLLENHTRKSTGTANRMPLVTLPKAVQGLTKLAVNAGRSTGSVRPLVGKQTNGKVATASNGPGKARQTSSSAVILPAAMTTLGARSSAPKTNPTTAYSGATAPVSAAMLKDKETEQLQRSLQRLGCEVTLIPTTGRTAEPRPGGSATPTAGPSRSVASPWPLRRVKDGAPAAPQRPRSQQNSVTPQLTLPGTISPSLQIVLDGAGSPPVQGGGGSSRMLSSKAAPIAPPPPSSSSENLVCHCRQKSDIFVAKTVGNGYCTAIDDIDGQHIGCCNELSNDMPNMLRPSPRVSFQLLCNMHRKRLEDHGCCAICGRFCTQGNFAMCKSAHIFHPHCADKYMLNTPYNPARPEDYAAPTLVLKCPHCNQECPNREIEVNIQLTSPPVLLPSRKSIVKPAKMTVSKTGGSNRANGASGSTNVSESFRTTVKSLVPRSLKNMLSVDHSTTNGGGGSGNTSHATTSTSASRASGTAKDSTPGAAGMKNRFTVKDFSYAVCTKKDDARVSEIITSGFDIETRFREYQHGTCLHVVCHHGTLAMAYLIMCRARSVDYLNIVDRELRTAVMCAVAGSKCDIVKLLLDSGADATLKGPYGMTVLHVAAKLGQHAAVRTILECARQRLTARDLMAFVNAVDNGRWTALAWAAENRHKQTVEQLISIGADVNVCDRLNNTSLHWAALSGCSDTLYLLMTKDCNPNLQNTNGETPLHIACRQGHAEICVVLLAMGASLNIRNTSNELPQDIIEDPNSECANIIAANVKMRSLSNNLKETHILCSDVSNGRERHPIQVVYYARNANERQLSVPKFKYIQSNVQIDSRITIEPETRQMPVCSCVDSCTSTESECLCSERTWYTDDGRLVADFNYLDPPTVIECGDLCDCNRMQCRNRVVQHGLDIPLQLSYIPGKAWGVRTMLPIPKGSFLVEYVGEILSDEAANHRVDDSYLFDLGNGFCIDASAYGNVSRFFNHSCQPNVSPVSVYYDHNDQRHPRVALFACRDIDAQEEICFDYGEKFWMVKRGSLVCRCNTAKCRYRQVVE